MAYYFTLFFWSHSAEQRHKRSKYQLLYAGTEVENVQTQNYSVSFTTFFD